MDNKNGIPKGYVSIKYILNLFYSIGVSYRSLTFYRQKGILPPPLRVKGRKEKYWNCDFMLKRIRTLFFLQRCLDFTIDQIRTFISNESDPENKVESISESLNRLVRNNILKIGDIIYWIWAYGLKKGLKDPSFSLDAAERIAIATYWQMKGYDISDESHRKAIILLTEDTYKIIHEDLKDVDNTIVDLSEKTKELKIPSYPPRTLKIKCLLKDKKFKEYLLKVNNNKRISVS